MKVLASALTILLTLPIWLLLVYQILVRVEASELMWFLYWAYLPASFVAQFLFRLADIED